MIRLLFIFIISCSALIACKKDSFITSPDAQLITAGGLDTLRFDTVFTSVGSVTKLFTIVNDNSQRLRISQVRLGGGNASPFKINVDGAAGTQFNNIEVNPNDSFYVFVRLTIDPNNSNLPFVVNDSIEIEYNGKWSKLYLQAYGQNARFARNWHITKDTTWDNQRPFVLMNPLYIDEGATLTIAAGTRIYSNATAAMVVNGRLIVNGAAAENERVIFRGDRLDEEYKDLPGGWGGLVFNETSTGNQLRYTNILNAYQGITASNGASLTLNQCMIHNAYDIGIQGINATINATNCLISQCGNDAVAGIGGSNVLLVAGQYNFNHCTIATYANAYQQHKQPVLYLANSRGGSASLNAIFSNSIIYGQGGLVEDEIVTSRTTGPSWNVSFNNVLYKVKAADPANAVFNNACIKNQDPLFDTISTGRREYNFRLRDNSPAVNAAVSSLPVIRIDLDGNTRPVGGRPDMGSYEKQ